MENAGRNPIPQDVLIKRREFEVELHRTGLSKETIVKKVNEMDQQYQWGNITLRTLQRDINAYYRDQTWIADGDIQDARYMRESNLAQLEGTMELLRLEIADKDKGATWGKGERIKALTALYKMQAGYCELSGWAMGKIQNTINPHDLNNPTSIQDIHEAAGRAYQQMGPEERSDVEYIINGLLEQKRKEEAERNAPTESG